ncbi:hypothetical protein TWF225_001912 [Orbilia oligospora]|nr:hypothetical protein TWF751_011606 [Orbilia oligospora]KAF3190947.1 hypothetical protein TWF225_001912 [Orbilia oligospora]KAF3265302.1 hypothetical protein TWF128_000580 [Orbilia oligospora]
MAIKERAPCFTEIKSESRSVLRKCYSELIVPNFREYDVKTADLKVIVYENWFKIGGGPTTSTTFRKVMRNTKPEFPKLTYLLNHEKFPIFIADIDAIERATICGGTPQLDNIPGKSIAAGGIKRLEIVPRSNGNLASGVFGLLVQWAYTGDYPSATNCSNPLINIKSNCTDKKVAILSLIMGEEDLPFVAIQKLGTRTEHDVTADTGETKESFGLMADALGDMRAEGRRTTLIKNQQTRFSRELSEKPPKMLSTRLWRRKAILLWATLVVLGIAISGASGATIKYIS